jgi:hypothetical protein
LDSATGQNKIEGIFLRRFHIDGKPQLQHFRRLIEKTGGDDIIENIASKTHRCFRPGLEIEPGYLHKPIGPGKKAHVVRREPDRPIVAVNCFVSNPDFHLADYGI